MKKSIAMILAGVMTAGALTACGSDTTSTTPAGSETVADETTAAVSDNTVYKIGVLQLVQHDALDASNQGFIDALDEAGINYEIDQQNASGDQSACQTIAEKLVNDNNDLIYAIATPAAQAVAATTEDIPIVGCAITDYAGAGLVDDNTAPGGNVTGASDLTPIDAQIELLTQVLPEAKTVGVLYCSAEANSAIQLEMTKAACEANDLEVVEFAVASSNEIQSVTESAIGKVDCLYAFTDNTIAAGMSTVAQTANENNLPIICGEEGMVNNGGLCTYTINYYELGKLAGQQAIKILTEGADPAEMAIEYYPTELCTFVGNDEVAAQLGIDLSAFAE